MYFNKKREKVTNFLWQFLTMVVRVVLLAFVMTIHPVFTFIFLVVHFLSAYLVVHFSLKTNFVETIDDRNIWHFSKSILKFLYEFFLCAFVLTFTWVNLFVSDPNRKTKKMLKMIMFYAIITLENLIFYMVWYAHRTPQPIQIWNFPWYGITYIDIDYIFLIVLPVLYILGLIIMCLYYRFCHPTKLNKV